MPPLLELQRDFSRALLGGAAGPIAGRVLPDRLTAHQRLQVYQNHVRISLREALAATFPVVARLVGPDYFAQAARRFVETFPPTGPVLAEYGADFPSFLEAAPDAPPYLSDVAWLEWALNLAYQAKDAAALEPASLARLTPEAYATLRLKPLPSTFLVPSPYPVQAIWRANQPDADGAVDLAEGGQTVLVWRARDGDAASRAVSPGEAIFLAALLEDKTLGDAAAAAIASDQDFNLAAAIAAALAEPIFQPIKGDTP